MGNDYNSVAMKCDTDIQKGVRIKSDRERPMG
jgi:hypothetical protein